MMLINGHFRDLNWRYLPYIRPMKGPCKGISPQNMALHGAVPPFWDPGMPIESIPVVVTPTRSMDKDDISQRDQHGYGLATHQIQWKREPL